MLISFATLLHIGRRCYPWHRNGSEFHTLVGDVIHDIGMVVSFKEDRWNKMIGVLVVYANAIMLCNNVMREFLIGLVSLTVLVVFEGFFVKWIEVS